MKLFLSSILAIFSIYSLNSQKLVDYSFIQSFTKQEIQAQYAFAADYDVELYKVTYTTNDINEKLDTASGLMVLPTEFRNPFNPEIKVPTIIFHHGTVNSPSQVPSNLDGGFELVVAFASKGYYSLGPDYIGNGTSRGFHPYVHADSEASASIDMLKASVELAEEVGLNLNSKLFLSGYSQGGHASMATHKELELNSGVHGYEVTAAAHLSGPYSIGEVMLNKILSDDVYLFASYIPNTILSYQEVYGNLYNDLSEVFKAEYIPPIQKFRDGDITLGELNNALLALLGLPNAIPKKMFIEEVLDSVRSNPNHPLNIALKDNNVYNFPPKAPTRMFYCMADDQVPYQNSLVADSVMNALGGVDVSSKDVAPIFNHGQCVLPTLIATLNFFEDFSTSNVQIENTLNVLLEPNPFKNEIRIQIPEILGESQLEIHQINGEKILTQSFNGNTINVNTQNIPTGIFIIKITNAQKQFVQKIIK